MKRKIKLGRIRGVRNNGLDPRLTSRTKAKTPAFLINNFFHQPHVGYEMKDNQRGTRHLIYEGRSSYPPVMVAIMAAKPIKSLELHYTVELVLSGTVLSGHPLLSGQLSKSRKLCPLIIVILTSIKRSPLLSGRGHPLLRPNELFLLS